MEHQDGRWFVARLLPYRTSKDRIDGMIVSLVDITRHKEAEAALQAEVDSLRAQLGRSEG